MNYKNVITSLRKQPDQAPRSSPLGKFRLYKFRPWRNVSPAQIPPGERSLAAWSKERRLSTQAIPSPAKLNTISQSRYKTHGFKMRPQTQYKLSVFIQFFSSAGRARSARHARGGKRK